jgi:hypothetical protein
LKLFDVTKPSKHLLQRVENVLELVGVISENLKGSPAASGWSSYECLRVVGILIFLELVVALCTPFQNDIAFL